MSEFSLAELVESAFVTAMPVVLGDGYEPREDQVRMALAVAAAIEDGTIEVVEAETGLGKSLAYLVPLILHCQKSGGRVVVSTYTKNLQRQLAENDFPHALRAADTAGGAQSTGASQAGRNGVSGAVLMGRSSYACRWRIESMLGKRGKGKRDGQIDQELARRLLDVLSSETGELDALPGASLFLDSKLRSKISCPVREAVCGGCGVRDGCFMYKARHRALDSQVIITNHALLFSDIAASGALLGPYDVLVVDEAHHLEDVATDFLSISFSRHSIRGGYRSIYTREYEDTIRYVCAKIADESNGDGQTIESLWARFHENLRKAHEKTIELFSVLDRNPFLGRTSPDGTAKNGNVFFRTQVTYGEGAPLFYGAESIAGEVSNSLGRAEVALAGITDIAGRHEVLEETGAAAVMRTIGTTAAETKAEFDYLVSASADDHVFYAELDGTSGVSALAASPVDVSARLGDVLEERSKTSVLTSATLAVDGDFSYTIERMGLTGVERVTTRRYDSPFDMDERRKVLVATHLPDPGDKCFLEKAALFIGKAVTESNRRALVLCTARSQIAGLERFLSRSEVGRGELFMQTDGASREDLMERFRHSRRGILAGLASFWEGIDLPGDQLELLVVLKLPFRVPTEPVTQARSGRCVDAGEDPFEKLIIPDVVLKLRQGMGRLIRTGNDRGVVVILDRRLWHSNYGKYVLQATTNRFVRCQGERDTIDQLTKHFNTQ